MAAPSFFVRAAVPSFFPERTPSPTLSGKTHSETKNITMEQTTRKGAHGTITDRFIELIENGVIPWHRVWTRGGMPQNLVTRKPYRGVNLLLLTAADCASNCFLTYRQLEALGGRAKKGCVPHLVAYWRQPAMPGADDADAETGPLYPSLQYRRVYNVSQCEGIPKGMVPRTARRNDAINACENIVRMMPNRPQVYSDVADAYYQPFHDTVYVPGMDGYADKEGYYADLFRELVHSTGHEGRLNRDGLLGMREYSQSGYTMEELVAEIGACFLKSFAGISAKEAPFDEAYAKAWVQQLRRDPRFIVAAAARAQKAVDYILGVPDGQTASNATA